MTTPTPPHPQKKTLTKSGDVFGSFKQVLRVLFPALGPEKQPFSWTVIKNVNGCMPKCGSGAVSFLVDDMTQQSLLGYLPLLSPHFSREE